MTDYFRSPNGQHVEASLLLDGDDPYADIVDSELYDQLPIAPIVRGNPLPPRRTTKHAAWRPAFFGRPFPAAVAPVPVGVPDFGSYPDKLKRNIAVRRAPQRMPSFFFRPGATIPTVPPRGPDGIAALKFSYADHATVTYSFATDIMRARGGLEYRASLIGCPREIYAFTSVLTDVEFERLQSIMAVSGSQGAIFQLALEFESLLVTADPPGGALGVSVSNTDYSDWMYLGARAVFVGPDDTIITGNGSTFYAVQGFSSTSITFNVALDSRIDSGWRVMPCIPCYLAAEETFEQHIVNAGSVSFKATAIIFGNATSDWSPRGVTLTTVTDASAVTYYVWDRRITIGGTIAQSTLLGTEIIDRHAALSIFSAWSFADFRRLISLDVADDIDRQYIKAFIGAVRGQQRVFMLPTWKPDLVLASGDASTGSILVVSASGGGIDYLSFFANSTAHRGLQFLMADGSVHYTFAFDCVDNLDGTVTILLDDVFIGAISMVSLMEKVRFDTDDFSIDWPEEVGQFSAPVRVVQQ